MSSSFKVCPICDTPNHPNAQVCTTCGASLGDVETVEGKTRVAASKIDHTAYDFRYGETDLLEASLSRPAQTYLVIATAVGVMLIVGMAAFAIFQNREPDNNGALPPAPEAADTLTLEPLLLSTVTQGPPTATASSTPSATFTPSVTPTRAPCRQQIVAGSSLIQALVNCGHRDQDVIPLVLEMNGLANANSIQAGQQIFIPWPTPTVDPNAAPTETATPISVGAANTNDDDTGNAELAALGIEIPDDPFAPTATATLPAGVTWHTVRAGENIITIAVDFDADVKVLSELNPEIDFARCEFGQRFGGEDCLVLLGQGQLIRVPAPTPTPTLSPTVDPNATATPTPTATQNVPNAVSPAERAVFAKDEIITLRWVSTASLGAGDAYRVEVTDLTSGIVYAALTTDITFSIPSDWQGRSADRHDYSWIVGIVPQSNPEQMRLPTQPRTFTWVGNPESE